MLRLILGLRFFLCCLMAVNLTHAVDFDYYFRALRSEKTCNNMTEKVYCQLKCGLDTGLCIGNDCYCLTVTSVEDHKIKDMEKVTSTMFNPNEEDQENGDFIDYNELPEYEYERRNAEVSQEAPEYLDESLFSDKTVLRHHIAHFCPNLDVARACIRACMKEGKPAFCGKDHVCYCGHRYSNKDRNSKADASSVYAQFKDMYEKYFGPNYKPELDA